MQSKSILRILSYLLIVVGALLVLFNKLYYFEDKNIIVNNIKNNSSINYVKDNKYIMYLKIPKINLYKGLYSIDSGKNNVKYNIEILSNSNMPNEKNGNLILAAHSGNGKNAYFNNLKKLSLNDEVNVFYDNIEYKYKVVDIYEINKTGKAVIRRNKNKNTLTMITCSTKDKTKQIVIVSELL